MISALRSTAMAGVALPVAALAALWMASALIALRVEALNPPIGRMVAVPGGRLSVIEVGEARPARGTVVLIHGATATASDPMEALGGRLAARGFRVLAIDRPGSGWSDRVPGEAGADVLATQAEAVGAALRAMEVERPIILGHSWGAALALRMALDRPQEVGGLLLAAPVAMPLPARPLPWWARASLWPPLTALLSRTVGPPLGLAYLERAAGAVFAPQETPENFLVGSRAALAVRPDAIRQNLRDLTGLPAALAAQAPRYPSLAVPAVIVAGEADPASGIETQAVPLSEALPEARLVRLPGLGHMVHYLAPEALVAEVEGLSERRSARDQEATPSRRAPG